MGIDCWAKEILENGLDEEKKNRRKWVGNEGKRRAEKMEKDQSSDKVGENESGNEIGGVWRDLSRDFEAENNLWEKYEIMMGKEIKNDNNNNGNNSNNKLSNSTDDQEGLDDGSCNEDISHETAEEAKLKAEEEDRLKEA